MIYGFIMDLGLATRRQFGLVPSHVFLLPAAAGSRSAARRKAENIGSFFLQLPTIWLNRRGPTLATSFML